MVQKEKEKKNNKKKTQPNMVKDLREYKKELRSIRFRLSAKDQQKTNTHRTLRKNIARTMTNLNRVAKEQKMSDDNKALSTAQKIAK